MESGQGKRPLSPPGESSASDSRQIDRQAAEPASGTNSTPREQGDCCLLDILAVALSQDSPGGTWYASTLELQLASFDVCVACRRVRTLFVTVDKDTPPSLWEDDGSTNDSPKAPVKRRLPALRAAGAAWVMPAGMLVPVLTRSALLGQVEWMQLTGFNTVRLFSIAIPLHRWDDWTQPGTRRVRSPRKTFEEMITFFSRENRARANMQNPCRVSWPPSLRYLSLGCTMHERMDWAALPDSLERLALGGSFIEAIESVTWPSSLKRLFVGGFFNKSIAGAAWPASLLQLTFGGGFDRPIADVAWPASLLELTFGYQFNQPIAEVVWPASLQWLVFGDRFDQEITDVTWPASLLRLALGNGFDQPITGVAWPASLNRLELGNLFNRPVTGVAWPTALQTLGFGMHFHQPIEGVAWPASLRSLTFYDRFDQELEGVVLPPSVKVVMLGDDGLDEHDNGADWPPGVDDFDQPPMLLAEDI